MRVKRRARNRARVTRQHGAHCSCRRESGAHDLAGRDSARADGRTTAIGDATAVNRCNVRQVNRWQTVPERRNRYLQEFGKSAGIGATPTRRTELCEPTLDGVNAGMDGPSKESRRVAIRFRTLLAASVIAPLALALAAGCTAGADGGPGGPAR